MNTQHHSGYVDATVWEGAREVEGHVQRCLGNQVRHLEVLHSPQGLILRGRAQTYHAKQVAQALVLEATGLPLAVNDITVMPPWTSRGCDT